MTQPADLKNLTDLEAVERLGDRALHQNRSACQPHSDDSYDDESLDRRHAALVLPELPQEASGDDHVCLLYGTSSRLLRFYGRSGCWGHFPLIPVLIQLF